MTSVSTDRRLGVNSGAALKVPCRAASTGNLTLSGEQTIDGVACVTGDRVLVKNQTSGAQNGIYIVDTGTWGRAPDWDGAYDVVTGTAVYITSGSSNSGTYWAVTTTGTITVGTTSVAFTNAVISSSASISFVQSGTAPTYGWASRTMQAKAGDLLSVEDVLCADGLAVSGNGSHDDTTGIQAALTYMNSIGGGVVQGTRGKTYLVSKTSTKTINGTANSYCLLLPDNVLFDLNGSTLKLAAAANAAIILNSTAGTTQNSDLGVCNGILDGNKANQTSPASGEMACIYLNNVMRPRVYDLRVKNVRNYAGRFLAIDKGYFNDLHCQDSDGDGWSFGISSSSQHVLRSFIDNIYAEGCDGSYDGAGGLNGNGAVFTTQYCQVGKVITKDCGGGIKFQDESQDTDIAELKFIGKTNGSANSGVKIQGNGAGLTPTRINVGLISSYNAYGNGLFISDVNGVSIGRYVGSSNGSGAGASGSEKNDVQLSLSNGAGAHSVQIGAIFVDTPAAIGVQINGASPRVDIGSIVVRNATGSAVSDSTTTSRIYIGKIQAVDDAGTLTYAFVSTGKKKGESHEAGDCG
jgi:hypothetical protein